MVVKYMNLFKFANKILLVVLVLPLLCNASTIKKPTEKDCLHWAAWKESRGEPVQVIAEVIHVIKRRVKNSGTTICKVLKEKGQFPYFRHGVKAVTDKEFLHKYRKAAILKSKLSAEYLYFNHKKHKWGKNTRKIGRLYFQTN